MVTLKLIVVVEINKMGIDLFGHEEASIASGASYQISFNFVFT